MYIYIYMCVKFFNETLYINKLRNLPDYQTKGVLNEL